MGSFEINIVVSTENNDCGGWPHGRATTRSIGGSEGTRRINMVHSAIAHMADLFSRFSGYKRLGGVRPWLRVVPMPDTPKSSQPSTLFSFWIELFLMVILPVFLVFGQQEEPAQR